MRQQREPAAGRAPCGSIGLRLPGQDMKAVVLDDSGHWLRECGVDEVGVIAVSGPNVFSGYRWRSTTVACGSIR